MGEEVVPLAAPSLAPLLEGGPSAWREARLRAERARRRIALADCEPVLPVAPRDFVDFYASLEHATNVGAILRPDRPLEPNWRRLPVAYHGRASTVVASGTPVRRPRGQLGEGRFGPTEALDFECELGFVAGPSTGHGEPLAIDEAAERIFGVVLLNDWSARDIQMWESRPLGPFLGKSFQTSISSWIVPLDELPKVTPREQDPPPEGYLREAAPFALDIPLEVTIDGELVTRTNARDLYWTLPQMLTHATVNGAKLTAGDLFGTGTISGPDEGSRACLLERFRGRRWLADGEEVVLASPLLGECRGTVVPATRPTGRASG